jgi:hypothetical protein
VLYCELCERGDSGAVARDNVTAKVIWTYDVNIHMSF